MNEAEKKPSRKVQVFGVAALYLFFFIVALSTPLLHGRFVNQALETTRDPILLPAPFLFLKWLSEIGSIFAWVVALSGIWLCFRPQRVFAISVTLGVALLLFTTLYGCYASVLLVSELNHAGFTARFFKQRP